MSAAADTAEESLEEAVDTATSEVDDRMQQLSDTIAHTAREQPFLSVAAAFGVGAVLGGGVPSWAVRLAASAASRAAVAYALAQVAPTGE